MNTLMNIKKAILFIPFFHQQGHVGNNRMERFIRWLSNDGYKIVVICAGSSDFISENSIHTTVTIRDPLGLFSNPSTPSTNIEAKYQKQRKPNALRRSIAYWLFNPDPTVVWAKRAAKHPLVHQALSDTSFILSSSPPESAHVGAWIISKKFHLPHIVDMRDGWIDEPLKPILQTSKIRHWIESRLEKKILDNAKLIFVTSDVWQELLSSRLPNITSKVHTLTNGYPLSTHAKDSHPSPHSEKELLLIHSGRFSGSDTRRTPDLLFNPLVEYLKNLKLNKQLTIQLIGSLSVEEKNIIQFFAKELEKINCIVKYTESIPRHELLAILPTADILLLLSASHAAIPSKLFEYIPTKKPIFVVTEKNSATWRICERLPQAILVDINHNDDFNEKSFNKNEEIKSLVPQEFTEEFQGTFFLQNIINNLSA